MKNSYSIINSKGIVIRIFPVIIALFLALDGSGQQEAMYTQYTENMMTINPAYAGSKGLLNMMAVSRNQWVGMANAPETRTFSLNAPIAKTNMGLGFSFLRDEIWPVTQTSLFLDYSYTLHLSNKRKLALGLKSGINFYEAGIADLLTHDPDDPVFTHDINRKYLPNFGVGAYFHNDRYYFGLSIPKLIKNTINKNGVATEQVDREELHAFFMSGYVFNVNRTIKFKPSALLRYVNNAPVSLDLNGTFILFNRLWLGGMFRPGDSYGGIFQVQLANLMKFGYSYDFPISRLGVFNKGTHEIMVSIDFNFSNTDMKSNRYF